MIRRTMIVGLLGLIIALAACGSAQTGATTGVGSAAQATPGGFFGGGEMPLSMKLPAGTLMLEDTDLAVTAEQAKELLPLWQMVSSLQGSTTSSQAELEAVFGQIQDAMTPEQLAAIEEMNQGKMQALAHEMEIGEQEGTETSEGGSSLPPEAMMAGMGEGALAMGPEGLTALGTQDQTAVTTEGMGSGSEKATTEAVVEVLETRLATV